jgi:MFS family permease
MPFGRLFTWFMIAEFISVIGAWMQTQAQQFLVEEKAGTPMEQALISFALTIVIPMLGPWGGSLADRIDRRRILIVVISIQSLLAALVGGLLQLHLFQLWQLSAIALMLGVTHAFEGPAYSSLLPTLVPREHLGAAVAIDRSIFHAGRIIGPALAGIAVARFGTASAFYANALSFIAPLIILITLPPPPTRTEEEMSKRSSGFLEGWRFARHDAPIFRMILIMAANTFFCSPFVIVLLTFYARRTLSLSAGETGWLMSLTGIGALIASFGLLAIPKPRRVHFLRGGAALSVFSMFLLAYAEQYALAAAGFGILTLGLNLLFGIGNQLIQERAPDEYRGRVSAIASLSFLAVIPFSGIFVALLHDWIGMRSSFAVCALGYAAFALPLLTFRWPSHDTPSS